MDRYTKGFVLASLVYFFLAAGFGVWMGLTETAEWVGFGHVHFNLLGFMAMMIYGVAYFILPRFNARSLKWPQLVPIHFLIANLGLIGMVLTSSARPSAGFTISAFFSLLSVVLFMVNLGVTLLEPQVDETEDEAPISGDPSKVITAETRVGEILTKWPETLDILVNNGFKPLADPGHREKVKQLPVTLGMACERHDLNCDLLVSLLNKAAVALESEKSQGLPRLKPTGVIKGKLRHGDDISHQHVIGDILRVYPETENIFKKYYGSACFSCPGQSTETIRQSTLMHNADEKKILAELNGAAGLTNE